MDWLGRNVAGFRGSERRVCSNDGGVDCGVGRNGGWLRAVIDYFVNYGVNFEVGVFQKFGNGDGFEGRACRA